MAAGSTTASQAAATRSVPKAAIVLLGQLLYVLIFLMAAPNHFTKQGIGSGAAQGVPLASIGVPLTGVIALVGGLSILLGYRAKNRRLAHRPVSSSGHAAA